MKPEQEEHCVQVVAKAFGWDKETTHNLGLMLWALFRYYTWRNSDHVIDAISTAPEVPPDQNLTDEKPENLECFWRKCVYPWCRCEERKEYLAAR